MKVVVFIKTQQGSKDIRRVPKTKNGCCTLGKMAADYDSENKKTLRHFLDE